MKECQDKLNSKKAEVEIIIKKEREIHEEFQKALGDSNKYEEYLTKILKKKIKRVKVNVEHKCGSGNLTQKKLEKS